MVETASASHVYCVSWSAHVASPHEWQSAGVATTHLLHDESHVGRVRHSTHGLNTLTGASHLLGTVVASFVSFVSSLTGHTSTGAGSAWSRHRASPHDVHDGCETSHLLAKMSGKSFRVGIFLDFVWLTTRTPHGAYVRRARRNRIGPHGGEIERLVARTPCSLPRTQA